MKPTGIAKSLNIGNPADGPYALDAIRRTGGSVGRVGDDEIVQGIRDLARTTGVFAETAGGVTVAVLASWSRTAGWTRARRPSSSTPARG